MKPNDGIICLNELECIVLEKFLNDVQLNKDEKYILNRLRNRLKNLKRSDNGTN